MTAPYPITAKDDLGRILADFEQCGERKDRLVGMFYFLWLGDHGTVYKPYNVTKILQADPDAGYHTDSPMWGEEAVMHHWGESVFGYYYSRDEWVMRRHVEMLTHADIDFLVFDTTNMEIYEHQAKMMLRILSEYRSAGFDTPKAMFYTNTESGKTVEDIYDRIYKSGEYSDSWFCLDGKPVIIAKEDECSPETRQFFNIKASQWPNEATKQGGWPWMDFERPQRVFNDLDGNPEIINVSVAQHPQERFGDSALYGETRNCGRSFHNGAEDRSPDAYKHGYNFAEQFERAIETDPPIVFVTGWNEWIFGRWQGTEERPIMFVDAANIEYSRDIEPMRGGYFDNYYLQLISFVRRYKGMEVPSEPADYKTIDINGAFDEFADTACYRDFPNGGTVRDCDGYDTHYHDESGRNEIVECRVSHDEENLYFYAKTSNPITRYDHQSTWMNLFLNIDGTDGGFYGYNYVVNEYQYTDNLTSLSKCVGETKYKEPDAFEVIKAVDYRFEGNELAVCVPKEAVGIKVGEPFKLQFKWADSKTEIFKMEDFYTKGDCAPIGRLNYVFEGK